MSIRWDEEKERILIARFPLEGTTNELQSVLGMSAEAMNAKAKRLGLLPPFTGSDDTCSKRGCGLNRGLYSKYCTFHATQELCRRNFGEVSNDFVNSAVYKLIRQSHRCALSGVPLYVGWNASTDHIIPICKGGTNSLDNLEWVSITANLAKQDMNKEDFIFQCLDIAVTAAESEKYKAYLLQKLGV